MSSTPADDPFDEGDDEGASPARSQRFWWVVGSLLVVAATAVVVWFGIEGTRGTVTATDVAFTRQPRQVTMVFDVDRPTGMVVTCHVKALDKSYATVGSVDVEVPASTERSTRQTVEIRTTTQAVTATVDHCRKV
ncbi:DUF4307 domain-containing protein [Janibacter sp. YIM B02568]|uniref:DUF4307 domain-containing protein n=1 Tax=Janibacter endophyticus TaxID=2806261 RepID=UPI00194DB63B|nr:DUF4307 domain-containing protein [Janibacter endophyticus]MBM6547084.1 DUF4307 domain-containing protein [Janibacter endophyticus]